MKKKKEGEQEEEIGQEKKKKKSGKQLKEEEIENSLNLEKMVRAPCCEKMGLKKGPWTPEEDQILVSFIQRYGHDNWRALPKQAGLLRCGKSCRLRWVNYLRPDIKRGNFSKEEEETIIRLHDRLGNRWSAIAAKLPGRTDNEIKNVWHTHLKKLVSKPSTESKKRTKSAKLDAPPLQPSLQRSYSDDLTSCATDSSAISVGMSNDGGSKSEGTNSGSSSLSTEEFADEIDDRFWLDALSMEEDDSAASVDATGLEIPSPPPPCPEIDHLSSLFSSSDGDDKDFWQRIFMGSAGDPQELSQIQLIF